MFLTIKLRTYAEHTDFDINLDFLKYGTRPN